MEENQEFRRNFDWPLEETIIQDNDLLFMAVVRNDLNELKSLIESGYSVNSTNTSGDCTLLSYIIYRNRVEMFNYVFSCEELEIDQVSRHGRTPLLCTVSDEELKEYFAFQLMDKGANLNVKAPNGATFLHCLAAWHKSSDALRLGKLVIEKGADMNAQDRFGATPLCYACNNGHFDWIYMLLYYGALATVSTDRGILPLTALSSYYLMPTQEEDHAHLLEILFNLTFEGDSITIRLRCLMEVMMDETLLFPKLVEIVSQVDYDYDELEEFRYFLIHSQFKTKHFKLFVDKFGFILQEMIQNGYLPTKKLIEYEWSPLDTREEKAGLILTILESDYAADFVQNCADSYPKIGRLLKKLNPVPEEVTKIVSLMLPHVQSVTTYDLDVVYELYGYCELFEILLHMEIKKVDKRSGYSIAEMYYYPSTSIEIFFDNPRWLHSGRGLDLLSYYNHPKLKELCSSDSVDEKIAAKAQSLPIVPSLLQLSRDMTRKFILNRYNIQSSMQFYTILRWLKISKIYKTIIALQRKLY